MKTVAVNIENLCARCHSSCRHCLLCSRHNITGVDYQRGETFARRFYAWLKDNRPDLGGMYYVGYSMDFPELPQYAKFFIQQTGMRHLMFDGMAFRSEGEIRELLSKLQSTGIRELHFTFYGLEPYHDRFAGRTGDFAYMMQTARIAREYKMSVSAGIMVTNENVDQIEYLYSDLLSAGIEPISLLMPHGKGRGYHLSNLRLTKEARDQLPEAMQLHFPDTRYRTEGEWLAEGSFPKARARYLTLSLTPGNIDRLENMHPADIITELEELDNRFYEQLPDIETLAQQYGKADNTQLFRFRDLYLQWQKRYMTEHPIYPDMTDERYSFSTHIFEE